MRKLFNSDRRGFLGTAAMTLAAAPFTPLVSADAEPSNVSTQSATHTSFASIKQIDAGVLNIGYGGSRTSQRSRSCSSCTAGPTTSIASPMSLPCWRPKGTA